MLSLVDVPKPNEGCVGLVERHCGPSIDRLEGDLGVMGSQASASIISPVSSAMVRAVAVFNAKPAKSMRKAGGRRANGKVARFRTTPQDRKPW